MKMTDTTSNPHYVAVTFAVEEVQSNALDLLSVLEENQVSVGMGIAASGMALGMLMSQNLLDDEKGADFVRDLVEWVGMYFTEGKPA